LGREPLERRLPAGRGLTSLAEEEADPVGIQLPEHLEHASLAERARRGIGDLLGELEDAVVLDELDAAEMIDVVLEGELGEVREEEEAGASPLEVVADED